MSMINQKQVLSLQQKLSPQQIQMIKLLELPTMQARAADQAGDRGEHRVGGRRSYSGGRAAAADFGGGIPPGRRNSFL